MTFYDRHREMCKSASDEMLELSRAHWAKVHKENIDANRYDLYIFSAKMLDDVMKEQFERVNRERR